MPADNSISSPTPIGIKRRLKRIWKRYLRWPVPLWRLQGYARLDLAGHQFKFRAATPALWWLRKLYEGEWQNAVREFFKETLQPGDVCLDIGPWIGIYTLLPAKLVLPGGRVYAFEPDPLARCLLERNLAANHITNVTVLPYAVSDRDGIATFDPGRGTAEGKLARGEQTVQIPTVAIRSFCESQNVHPAAIKISAMGLEPKILAGANGIVQTSRAVILEFCPPVLSAAGADPSAFFQSLFTYDRRVVVLYELGGERRQPGTELTRDSVPADYMKLALV